MTVKDFIAAADNITPVWINDQQAPEPEYFTAASQIPEEYTGRVIEYITICGSIEADNMPAICIEI